MASVIAGSVALQTNKHINGAALISPICRCHSFPDDELDRTRLLPRKSSEMTHEPAQLVFLIAERPYARSRVDEQREREREACVLSPRCQQLDSWPEAETGCLEQADQGLDVADMATTNKTCFMSATALVHSASCMLLGHLTLGSQHIPQQQRCTRRRVLGNLFLLRTCTAGCGFPQALTGPGPHKLRGP
jgi:hypothetical protein